MSRYYAQITTAKVTNVELALEWLGACVRVLVTFQLILLTETFPTRIADELVNFVVQNLNVFLEIRVTVEGCTAQLT